MLIKFAIVQLLEISDSEIMHNFTYFYIFYIYYIVFYIFYINFIFLI